jgi:hypothetical protein
LHVFIAKNIQVFAIALMLSFSACYGDEERLRNVTNLFLKFLVVKVDPLNVVSRDVAVYKNVSTTLNEDLVYYHITSEESVPY